MSMKKEPYPIAFGGGRLLEFGVRIPKGYAALKNNIYAVLEDGENYLPGLCRELMEDLYQLFLKYEEHFETDGSAAQTVGPTE